MAAKLVATNQINVLSSEEQAQYESIVSRISANLREGRGVTTTYIKNASNRVIRAVGRTFIGAHWDVQLHEIGEGFSVTVTHPNLLHPPIDGGGAPDHTHLISDLEPIQSTGQAATAST